MSYTSYTWNEGDLITADRLNNIEKGISTIIPSGNISTGPLQNGDTLIFQTPDNKIRKMRYVEAKVEILHLKSGAPDQLEDVPDLVGDPESISNLYKLLDLEAFTIFKGIRVIEQSGRINLFPCSATLHPCIDASPASPTEDSYQLLCDILPDEYTGAIIYPNLNKGLTYGTIHVGQHYIECKGFIPVEE